MIALKDSLGSDFVERVRAIFSEDGLLAKAKNFEYRPEQQEMAVAVARALEEERHLVVEAGTGVGKSLAYLVPAMLFALEQKKKAIISTHTINLQEQLLHKDIPILKKILPVEFEAALMKGRQNYLCPRRLERALAAGERTFHHARAGGAGAHRGMGADDDATGRSAICRRAGPESLGAGVQRGAHLHDENLRAESATVFTSRRASGCSPRTWS